ncbi:hypothetical protein [Sulfuriferula nivalis]|uniref:Uncharacterized protein n=1 Tax=Sulfuriferula nivalis TaxID=2675298 RepID=A0A809RKQ7_9PROT|nr:hypothetical protein [Sulfuriferula nivalis]BBP02146.1 hypothetical protein SFSGTM_28540 [Sulfuriferula nivalis]
MKRFWMILLVLVFQPALAADDGRVDLRSYQHGLNFLRMTNGNYLAVFASDGIPPKGDWEHDIYYAQVHARSPNLTAGSATRWIAAPEAQEPVSSAINAAGNRVCVTWEDGNPDRVKHEVAQLIYVADFPFKGNPYAAAKVIFDGGHSGHVATVGNSCVVFWANDWIDDDGVDNLGTGDQVYVSNVAANGTVSKKIRVASGRAWWPQIAGSANKACLVWQKFVPHQMYADLYFSLYDPETRTFTNRGSLLQHHQLYYHYSVTYVPKIARFLIVASSDAGMGVQSGRRSGGGIAWLIDNQGHITAQQALADGIVRESNIIVSGTTAVIARLKAGASVFGGNSAQGAPGGLSVLSLTPASIRVTQEVDDDYAWQYEGFDGFFIDDTHVYTAALSDIGIRTKTYVINKGVAPEDIP